LKRFLSSGAEGLSGLRVARGSRGRAGRRAASSFQVTATLTGRRSRMASLTIQVHDVEAAPKPFHLEAGAEWWATAQPVPDEPPVVLLAPLVLDFEGYALGKRLLFRGNLRGRFELVCGRCADPYEQVIDERIELMLEPNLDPEAERDAGLELDPEELGVGRYLGDELDFEPVLVETLLLSWPMQPRCTEGCRGLCPACGVNRNREDCSCDPEAAGRVFSGLGALLDRTRRDDTDG
jgi:uncharacterized protein